MLSREHAAQCVDATNRLDIQTRPQHNPIDMAVRRMRNKDPKESATHLARVADDVWTQRRGRSTLILKWEEAEFEE